MYKEFCGVNDFTISMCQILLDKGNERFVRGKKCRELNEPLVCKIIDPTQRLTTIPSRRWNIYLAYAEALMIASGRNNLSLITRYLKRMIDFSDDSVFLRGGYGPRIRQYNNKRENYKIDDHNYIFRDANSIDQFDFVINMFTGDKNTREAIIVINDVNKDCKNEDNSYIITKDFPCTSLIHFMRNPSDGSLNMYVHMRSNDILWGASAVNIFNFTFMQEYFSSILQMPLGSYYHLVDNIHYYLDQEEKIIKIARSSTPQASSFQYNKTLSSLNSFDTLLKKLAEWEKALRDSDQQQPFICEDDFFNDWASVFYFFATKNIINISNPDLHQFLTEAKKNDTRKY